MYFCLKINIMETLVIQSKSKSNVRLLSALARKMGDLIEVSPKKNEDSGVPPCFAIENAWAKDWLTPEEDEAWKDL